ncbi:hypothetical protein DBR23_24530 [Acidovorax sp. HMWF018]|uniref:hypothetical protein n=1 Tax=Acidovorax sp. HMWF018 TaxID=2056855 RepID=UPI000D372BBA|nr:hypothetical protein [Acidovorax sp. HMWF018]PTT35136.1 hypothetical protein DBR23_24530 [Acidovorax sp. HMWF018]
MDDQGNTSLALAGAVHALLGELIVKLVDKGVLTSDEALGVVRKTRTQLEAPQLPGGIRASVYLENLEDFFAQSKPG